MSKYALFNMKYLPVFLNILLIPKIYQGSHFKHPAVFPGTATPASLRMKAISFSIQRTGRIRKNVGSLYLLKNRAGGGASLRTCRV